MEFDTGASADCSSGKGLGLQGAADRRRRRSMTITLQSTKAIDELCATRLAQLYNSGSRTPRPNRAESPFASRGRNFVQLQQGWFTILRPSMWMNQRPMQRLS